MNLFDLINKPTWHTHAACRGFPTAWFFPEQGGDTIGPRRICAGCSVRAECAEAGRDEFYGVWGGQPIAARNAELRAAS